MVYRLYTTVCHSISVIYHSVMLLISTSGVVYLGLYAAAGVICGIIGRQSITVVAYTNHKKLSKLITIVMTLMVSIPELSREVLEKLHDHAHIVSTFLANI